MKFEIQNKILEDTVCKMEAGINNKNVIQALNGIKIEAKDNHVTFYSSRQDLSIRLTIKEGINIVEAGEVVIPAHFLSAIVKSQDGNTSYFDIDETKGIATIKSKNTKIEVYTYDSSSYPKISFNENESKTPIEIRTKVFKNLYNATKHAAALVKDHQSLLGINFKFENGNLTASSTDARRLAIVKTNLELNYEEDFTINKDLCKIIDTLTVSEGSLKIYRENNTLLIINGDMRIKVALIQEEFPNLSKLVPETCEFTINVNKYQIIPILEKISLLNKSSLTPAITLNFSEEVATISAEFPEFGSLKENFIPTNMTGKPISIGLDPKFFLQALNALEEEAIKISIRDELSPIMIENQSNKNNRQIISPIYSR